MRVSYPRLPQSFFQGAAEVYDYTQADTYHSLNGRSLTEYTANYLTENTMPAGAFVKIKAVLGLCPLNANISIWLRKNRANTSLFCSWPAAFQSKKTTSYQVRFADDDEADIRIHCEQLGNGHTYTIRWLLTFIPDPT